MLTVDRTRLATASLCIAALVAAPVVAEPSAQPTAAAAPAGLTSLADLKGARTLDVERYRPQLPLAACAAAPLPVGAAPARLQPALAKAQAYSDSKQGLGLLVLHKGRIIHQQYAAGVTGDRLLVTASMAKSVLGLVVGIAIDKRLIGSVDDPLSRYLPEWRDDPRGKISIAQALQMHSGLGPSNFATVLLGPDVGAAALATPLATPPGSRFAYNNAVSQLLLRAVDRQAAGAGLGGYAGLLQSALWCPLGNGPAALWVDGIGSPRGYAGLNASAHDWARLGELVRQQGRARGRRLVPGAWVRAMATPSPTNPQYGYQLWLGREWTERRRYSAENPVTVPHSQAFVAADTVYFDGFGGQRVYVIPSKQLTIVRFGEVDLSWDDAIVPNAIASAVN